MTKKFDELTFADDFIFCHVLESNKDMCRRLAELLTGRKVKEIVDVEQQKSIRESRDGKGVRFDVVFRDEEDTIYDIEMQTTNNYDLPMRARYYQSLADLEALKRGERYNEIRSTYIIFICNFDPFQKGDHKYLAKTMIEGHNDIRYDNREATIFFNTKYKDKNIPEDIKRFLDYIAKGTSSDAFTEDLDALVALLKREDGRREEYMTLEEKFEEYRDEGHAAGVAEGRSDGRLEAIRKMLTKLTEQDVLSLGYSEEEIIQAKAEQ